MSASMWVAPPPLVVQQRYVDYATKSLLARRLFDTDGTLIADTVIVRGDTHHVWLTGVRAGLAANLAPIADSEVLADVDALLALIAQHGSAQVVIER